MSGRRRLDTEMVRRGLVESREQARSRISDGQVLVGGAVAEKAARLVGTDEPIHLSGSRPRFVSRGGEKLDAALDRFDVEVTSRRALDAGASTGGFTDCLLQRGAAAVIAVDVGYGQLHERLRADSRVTVLERTNIRDLHLEEPVDLVVADLSFISLQTAAPGMVGANARPGADVVVLVKPQFESGRAEASKGRGVVRDPLVWRRVLEEVRSSLHERGAVMMGVMVSPLLGARGNVEFLAHLRAHDSNTAPGERSSTVAGHDLDDAVAEALELVAG